MRRPRRSDPAKLMHHRARQLLRRSAHDARASLNEIKGRQRLSFEGLHGEYEGLLDRVSDEPLGEFLSLGWRHLYARSFNKESLRALPFSFLRPQHGFLDKFGVFPGKEFVRTKLAFLEARLAPERLSEVLTEDFVGEPELYAARPLFSPWNIIHLDHLIRFSEATRCDLKSVRSVVEWGGGFGNMAKIMRRLGPDLRTHVVIDLPRVSCLQWLYLATIFGKDDVRFLKSPEEPVSPGKINLLPVSSLAGRRLEADLFLSTFALSESSEHSIDLCSRDWFGAKHLLLSFQANDNCWWRPEEVGARARRAGAVIEEIHPPPHASWYAFR
ncbi:MAG: hypothetical protein ACHQ2Z_03510 [Elusimicrobiota bacterium]